MMEDLRVWHVVGFVAAACWGIGLAGLRGLLRTPTYGLSIEPHQVWVCVGAFIVALLATIAALLLRRRS